MSRYGHEEVLAKSKERPYPPILDFVPPPPSPSAASSGKLVQKANGDEKNGLVECSDQAGQIDEDSFTDDVTEDDDKESLPNFPNDETASCLPQKCLRKKDGEDDSGGEEEMDLGKTPWSTMKNKRRVGQLIDVQTRLSDISIHEEEYQAALSAGKVNVRGKGQQLYEPLLGEVSPEADRIGFHFFLKKTGVLSIVARSMLALYDDPHRPPPEDAIEYLINSVGYKLTIRDTITELHNYKESLLVRYQRLSVENDWLHRAMDAYEPTELDINGRPPNPFNRYDRPPDEYDFEYDVATYNNLKQLFSTMTIASQDEQELAYGLENSIISLEEFDSAMREVHPNYLDLTDVSSDEEVPTIKINPKTSSRGTTPVVAFEVGVSQSDTKNISPAIVSVKSPKDEQRKTVATIVRTAQTIKPSVMGFKPAKRRMTIKSEEDKSSPHRGALAKIKESRKTKRKNLKESGSANHLIAVNSSGVNKAAPEENYEEFLLNQHSLTQLYDHEKEQLLEKIIMEEGVDIKRPIQWFTYDYQDDGYKDLCGFEPLSVVSSQNNKSAEDVEESDNEEQVPIVLDTSDDDTGMENIKPEVYGHIDTQTVVGDLGPDSDDDQEFLKDYDYQEPELSSDEEDFGRRRKFSKAKFKIRNPDSSGEEDEIEQKFVPSPEQIIDVMEMEPIVPYSSDEDQLDIEMKEPPCYEFPVTRTKLSTYSHSYRS